jgi:hypothetical protein
LERAVQAALIEGGFLECAVQASLIEGGAAERRRWEVT